MEKEIAYPSDEELSKMDSQTLEDYLLTLTSIDEGLKEYIEEKKVENND